jgi:hypothetical protein
MVTKYDGKYYGWMMLHYNIIRTAKEKIKTIHLEPRLKQRGNKTYVRFYIRYVFDGVYLSETTFTEQIGVDPILIFNEGPEYRCEFLDYFSFSAPLFMLYDSKTTQQEEIQYKMFTNLLCDICGQHAIKTNITSWNKFIEDLIKKEPQRFNAESKAAKDFVNKIMGYEVYNLKKK